MIYVDENLCTGCELCVDACKHGALSVRGRTASIDETLCTSCGQCVDLCLTGAIISVETVSESSPETALAGPFEARSLWATSSPLSPVGLDAAPSVTASPRPAASSPSRLQLIEKALSGLVSIAAFVLDRRRSRSVGLGASSAVCPAGSERRLSAVGTGRGAGSGLCQGSGGRQGLGTGQGLGGGRGPRDGRGPGRGRGRASKRNRST